MANTAPGVGNSGNRHDRWDSPTGVATEIPTISIFGSHVVTSADGPPSLQKAARLYEGFGSRINLDFAIKRQAREVACETQC